MFKGHTEFGTIEMNATQEGVRSWSIFPLMASYSKTFHKYPKVFKMGTSLNIEIQFLKIKI